MNIRPCFSEPERSGGEESEILRRGVYHEPRRRAPQNDMKSHFVRISKNLGN